MNDRPAWHKWGALALAIVVIALIILFRHRLGPDFIPLDASRVGPNIVASILTWVFLVIAGVLIWPPTRKRIHAFMDKKLDRIHIKHDEHAAKLDHLLDRIEDLHRKQDESNNPPSNRAP